MSKLPEVEDVPTKDRLILEGTKYLPSLEGMVWENLKDGDLELPNALKLFIKRAKLNFSIILSDSGANTKFDVFQRLNTGGTYASSQEVRNSVMIMINKPTFTWFKKLSMNEDFLNSISITDRLIDEQYPMELVLRHIALTHYDYSNKKELSDYFDDIIEQILLDTTFDYDNLENKFNNTFSLINNIIGRGAFKRFADGRFKGKFLESAFEAISVGISKNYDDYDLPDDNALIKTKIEELHLNETFNRYTGSGSNARTRIPNIIPFAIDYFSK